MGLNRADELLDQALDALRDAAAITPPDVSDTDASADTKKVKDVKLRVAFALLLEVLKANLPEQNTESLSDDDATESEQNAENSNSDILNRLEALESTYKGTLPFLREPETSPETELADKSGLEFDCDSGANGGLRVKAGDGLEIDTSTGELKRDWYAKYKANP